MHPLISRFISQCFYNSELSDAHQLAQLIGEPSLYKHYSFDKLVVYDTRGFEEFHRNSFRNELEVHVVRALLRNLLAKLPDTDPAKIGVVSPYSAQIAALAANIRRDNALKDIEIKTVDGFQGSEKDIIVFSTVRSSFLAPGQRNPKKGIGFLSDSRRMNVSLSRCRLCLIVVGDIYKLRSDKKWQGLVEYAFQHASVFRVTGDHPDAWLQDFQLDPLKYQLKEYKRKRKADQLGEQQQQQPNTQGPNSQP